MAQPRPHTILKIDSLSSALKFKQFRVANKGLNAINWVKYMYVYGYTHKYYMYTIYLIFYYT